MINGGQHGMGTAIAAALYQEAPTVEARADLAASYDMLGNICSEEGRLSEAEKYCLQAREIHRVLCGEAPTLRYRHALAYNCELLGDIFEAEGRLSEIKECFQRSLELCNQFYEETHIVAEMRRVYILCTKLGAVSADEGRKEDALAYTIKAADTAHTLCDTAGTTDDYDLLAAAYYNMAAVADDRDVKKKLIAQAHGIWSQLSKAYPDRAAFSDRKNMAKNHLNQPGDDCKGIFEQ